MDENTEKEPANQPKPTPLDKLLGLTPLGQEQETCPQDQTAEPNPPDNTLEPSPLEPGLESSPLKASLDEKEEPRPPQVHYIPAVVPVNNQFQAGVTYVGMDGYIYVQEIKPGERTF